MKMHIYLINYFLFSYYISTVASIPGVRHLFRTSDIPQETPTDAAQCLTCKKTIDEGEQEQLFCCSS